MAEDASSTAAPRRAGILSRSGAHIEDLDLLRKETTEQDQHLHQRLDNEIAGIREEFAASIRDEVARLDDLIVGLAERVDAFLAEAGRANALADQLDVRLSEAADLREQPRAAERMEARRLADLEERLRLLEERLDAAATSPDR